MNVVSRARMWGGEGRVGTSQGGEGKYFDSSVCGMMKRREKRQAERDGSAMQLPSRPWVLLTRDA